MNVKSLFWSRRRVKERNARALSLQPSRNQSDTLVVNVIADLSQADLCGQNIAQQDSTSKAPKRLHMSRVIGKRGDGRQRSSVVNKLSYASPFDATSFSVELDSNGELKIYHPKKAHPVRPSNDELLYYKGRPISLDHAGDIKQSIAFAKMIEEGLDTKTIRALLDVGFTQTELDVVIPARTLKRRLVSDQQLTREESAKLVRYVRTFSSALEIFGDKEKALAWLRAPKKKLDGKTPLDLLSNEIAAQVVEDYLGQIQSGYFA
ncbi:antitoxin Xre/MbcA/ParS toxin-binding domain-containing protein [Chitinibacter tainanensis]|uniref:antitoxin Xre/MbcA/ParS toxin-binding domain-containing protein n=1 Tax=Chitinibacter tainanensis TaxID=230667 RepID=UPI00146F9483|nr:antitoxin Xre/MbcA/ParS toxin-binding domain-containing protein [Chitinibacter tainanensis]